MRILTIEDLAGRSFSARDLLTLVEIGEAAEIPGNIMTGIERDQMGKLCSNFNYFFMLPQFLYLYTSSFSEGMFQLITNLL